MPHMTNGVRFTNYYITPDGRNGQQTRALIGIGARLYGQTNRLVGSNVWPNSRGVRVALRHRARIPSIPSRRGFVRFMPINRGQLYPRGCVFSGRMSVHRPGWHTVWPNSYR